MVGSERNTPHLQALIMPYLVTYRPLVGNGRGKAAIKQYGLAPYVDDSCRREPDFEAAFPSISGLCRSTRFAPRLVSRVKHSCRFRFRRLPIAR